MLHLQSEASWQLHIKHANILMQLQTNAMLALSVAAISRPTEVPPAVAGVLQAGIQEETGGRFTTQNLTAGQLVVVPQGGGLDVLKAHFLLPP